ncbi:beta-1,4-glucuronyltransferase 1 [Agrilus planipennis]|uniref:Beta-1,4-glucuronyltransferase 1 n=1 Tax=Agrilus planipennis TaxID=224129 RepID=A0A1W4WQ34_AGRPL|nr:beta-1,4-glucuronyltransferase 1 [Agrilus planipennis]
MTHAPRRVKLRGILFCIIVIYSVILTLSHNSNTCQNRTESKLVYVEKEVIGENQFSAKIDCRHTFDLRAGRWDNQILYKLFDNVITGDHFYNLSTTYKVSLATQSSLEKLFSLQEVAAQWSGPISVAIYCAGNDELSLALLYITYLRKCNINVRRKISFHFALPKDRMPTVVEYDFNFFSDTNCVHKDDMLNILLKKVTESTKKWRTTNPYPQNHMRNIARKNCVTPYVFLTDVDVIPCNNMAEKLNKFLETDKCDKCGFVIPTYEIDNRVSFPANKSEIVRLSKKQLARPFHQKVFIYNQYATNFSRWEQDTTEGTVRVSHPVTNFEMFYEPFYVAKDSVPPHDERFIGYGFTRNTQVYEMYVAGYKFQVVTPIFAVHWGLQDRRGRPYWREKQNSHNNKLFQTFKKELFARYQNDPLHLVNRSFKH